MMLPTGHSQSQAHQAEAKHGNTDTETVAILLKRPLISLSTEAKTMMLMRDVRRDPTLMGRYRIH